MTELQKLAIQAVLTEGSTSPCLEADQPTGWAIVVLIRGWVYYGCVEHVQGGIRVTKAKNIRRWGTTKGLGEIVSGPTSKTVLDDSPDFFAPTASVVHILEAEKW